MKITKCNVCGKIKKEKNSSLSKESGWVSGQINSREEWLFFDLCGKCSEKMLKYIKKYLKIKKGK